MYAIDPNLTNLKVITQQVKNFKALVSYSI